MKTLIFLCFYFIFIFTIMFLSCNVDAPYIETKELEETSDGYLKYYTNDDSLLDTYYTKNFTGSDLGFTYSNGIYVKLKKYSGDKAGHFGVFATVDTNLIYMIIINLDQEYRIYKITGDLESGVWDGLKSDTLSDIKTGYENENELYIAYEDFEKRLRFWINGVKVYYEDLDIITTDDIAFYCQITNDENFPDEPVDVRVKFVPVP